MTGYGNKGALHLLDKSNWTTYKNTDATYAIGGPTLDLFILAYNKVKGTDYTVSTGKYGPKPSVSATEIKYTSSDSGGIFCNGTSAYWFASPSDWLPDAVIIAGTTYIGPYTPFSAIGIRPIVCIPNSTFNSKYK